MPKFAISSAVVGRADASFTRHGAFVRTAGIVFWEMRSGGFFGLLDWREQTAAQNRKKAQYDECFNSEHYLITNTHRLMKTYLVKIPQIRCSLGH